MTTLTFDSLDYFEKLKDAGFTEKQAKVQASVLQTALNMHDETSRKELATKGDVQDVRLEIEKVRKEIRETELRLIKWQLGGWVALAAIMARGFGWLGF